MALALKEDSNGKEKTYGRRDNCEAAPGCSSDWILFRTATPDVVIGTFDLHPAFWTTDSERILNDDLAPNLGPGLAGKLRFIRRRVGRVTLVLTDFGPNGFNVGTMD